MRNLRDDILWESEENYVDFFSMWVCKTTAGVAIM